MANERRWLLHCAAHTDNPETAETLTRDAQELGERLIALGFDENGPERRHLTWPEATLRVKRIYALRQRKYKQREIAAALGIGRPLVAFYLTKSKARYRAGIAR